MGIFKNRDVLRPEFIPEHIVERKVEVERLWSELAHLLEPTPSTPYNTHLVGPKGTGKTVILQYLLKILRSQIDTSKVEVLYTVSHPTSFSMLSGILSSVHHRPKLPRSFFEFWNDFSETFKEKVVVIILDDIDKLMANKADDLNILYHLSRRNKTSIITLSNKGWALDRLGEPRHSSIESSFRPQKMIFKPYSASQLFGILKARVPLAFVKGTCSDDVILGCAQIASYSGDARWALALLLKAGDVTNSRGGEEISEDDIKISNTMVEEIQLHEKISVLTRPEKVYLKAICLLSMLSEPSSDPMTLAVTAKFKQIAGGHSVKVYSDIRLKQLRRHLVEEQFITVYQGKGLGRARGTEWRISFEEGYAPGRILSIFDSELI